MPMPALNSLLRKAKSAVVSFLLVAPLMLIALSVATTAPRDAWAAERETREAADNPLLAATSYRLRLKKLERQAALFKPDGTPVRAKVSASMKGDSDPIPQAREHILLGRQISAHKASIRKLQARVKAFEKEARGHEMGHNLDMPPATASKEASPKRTRRAVGERVNNPQYGAGLSRKSKALERDIAALEKEARAIYKKPGRLK